MSNKVQLSKDGKSIEFKQSETLPATAKKFRRSPDIDGFYRFVYENNLQKEAYTILESIAARRKTEKKKAEKAEKKKKK
ncbi:MAG: hypothetical protein KDD61_04695 [Bdellovibrionales bacterium]|nr:hypothetical protein [Bdellovibrionales bacterium]